MLRVEVDPRLLHWAFERSGRDLETIVNRFPKFTAWLSGDVKPTLKQLEDFAKSVHLPIGYLFLPQPPEEAVPIPDLRTMGSAPARRISPDLIDTIYLCQSRQAWYREHARTVGELRRSFVGSITVDDPVDSVAATIRRELGIDLDERRRCPTWTDALRRFIRQAEDQGVLVMVNGVVGNNTHRKLDPAEFRGFALADDYAPLVFINGADTKAAQMFTLAHEIAHLWLGESALSDVASHYAPTHRIEKWCNRVAAEVLVPMKELKSVLPGENPLDVLPETARKFKVSTLVILRRLHDAGRITPDAFKSTYEQELERLLEIKRPDGGRFYLTQEARASRRFVRALLVSTLEGGTLFRDAFRLLGIKKEETFRKFGERLGIIT